MYAPGRLDDAVRLRSHPVRSTSAASGTYFSQPATPLGILDEVARALVRHAESTFRSRNGDVWVSHDEINQAWQPRPGLHRFREVLLTQIDEATRASGTIFRLTLHCSQKKLQPLLNLTPLTNRLQAVVVLPSMRLEVPGPVEKRGRQGVEASLRSSKMTTLG